MQRPLQSDGCATVAKGFCNRSSTLTYRPCHIAVTGDEIRRDLANWRLNGFGPKWLKVGGRIFYRQRDLDAFVDGEGA